VVFQVFLDLMDQALGVVPRPEDRVEFFDYDQLIGASFLA